MTETTEPAFEPGETLEDEQGRGWVITDTSIEYSIEIVETGADGDETVTDVVLYPEGTLLDKIDRDELARPVEDEVPPPDPDDSDTDEDVEQAEEQQSDNDDTQEAYDCPECGESFESEQGLYGHQASHTASQAS